ncbi:zinc ribbon domain-containing protein [Blautia sp.]|uniref:zinc ribbon domain-containing protein n=1 Tax=Blautia sp. TaxID=1955243 RepID=UPI002603DB59|nr:zinc-ribbon domain-containing protein [Blautia sp.]
MKCSKCGKEINEQAKFCKYCGTPVQVEKQVSSANASKEIQRRNSKTWIIIASILLGILVLTGVTVLTVKMTGEKDKATQKVEKPKQEDPVKPEESTEEVKAETPEQAFENYLVFLVDAVNNGDYTDAEKVMVKDSPLYQDQKKLVEKLYADGTKEKLTKQGIKSQEDIDDTHVRLISDEEYEITYADGTVKTVPQSYAYVCELTEQGWLLTTLEAVNGGGTSSSNKDAYIQAYQEYISANQEYLSGLKNDDMTMYAIVDVQNDGIPEVLFCKRGSFTGETNFLYMGKDGTIKSYDGFYLISFDQNTGLVYSTTGGGHSAFEESIFQYDEGTDTYKEIHHGEGFLYSENGDDGNSEMIWDGVAYPTMTEYNAKVNEVFNKAAAQNPEYKDYTFEMDLLKEISNF